MSAELHRLRRSTAPVLCVDHGCAPTAQPLVAFGFAAEDAAAGLRWLAGNPADEVWQSNLVDGFHYASVSLPYRDAIDAAAERAYRQLLQRVRGSATPYLLRIWNFFPAINQGEGDAERYRQFCVGRARAVDRAFHDPAPAATAIGWPLESLPSDDPARSWRIEVSALCGVEPGIALENPRQTPAWRYPREYGPVSPGFSRGVVVGQGATAVLLASGTASIVGHVSQHVGDVAAQLEESFANLEALLDEGSRRSRSVFRREGCMALRVYLRDPAHTAQVAGIAARWLGSTSTLRVLHGHVCRRELEVEIEGVFAAE
jgi:chorismate lyase/3-hydroxybenzoate synthase